MSTTARTYRPGTETLVAIPGTDLAVSLYVGDVDRGCTVSLERNGRTIAATVEQHDDLAAARAAANSLYRTAR